MKKNLLAVCMLLCFASAHAQVSIQAVLPLSGMIPKNSLWNIALVNASPAPAECRLEFSLRDRASGMELLTATSGLFTLPGGAKQVNASILMPIQYNVLSSDFTARNDDFIPIGNYIICYKLSANKNPAAEECTSFDVEPLSPPLLINPSDSSILETVPSQFSWIPPAPLNLFSRLQYDLIITEVLPGQKAEEAMQMNLPFYNESNLSINQFSSTGMAADFEKDKWYAWQVIARDGFNYAAKTDVWVFKIGEKPLAEMLVELAPFIKMKKDNPERGVAPNGILKLSYINETTDSIGMFRIKNLTEPDKKGLSFTIALKQGENLISYDVIKKLRLKENNTYEVSTINSRKESWSVVFSVQKYDSKTKVK